MFGKFLSVANDSQNVLEESDNRSYVRDSINNLRIQTSEKIFKEADNCSSVLKIKCVIVNIFSTNFCQLRTKAI